VLVTLTSIGPRSNLSAIGAKRTFSSRAYSRVLRGVPWSRRNFTLANELVPPAITTLCLRPNSQKANPRRMAFRARRRLFGLLTAVLFTISSVGHVYAATEALMKMPAPMADGVMSDHGMSDHGMDCGGGDDKAARVNCMAMCATAVAILSQPVTVPVVVAMLDVASGAELPPPARGVLPEPHPPRR